MMSTSSQIYENNNDILLNLDIFLNNEKSNNSLDAWSKLDKTIKLKKLICFADKYKELNSLSDEQYNMLLLFFKNCLDKKKLQRVKEVMYNKEKGEIINIAGLYFNKSSNQFTLKNIDKRISTTQSLPKPRHNKTIKCNDVLT